MNNDLEKLQELCINFDPFTKISPDMEELLNKFQITDLSDPFKVTNQLLQILENNPS